VPATAEICGSWPSATSRGSCEEVDGEEDDGAGEDDDPGALQERLLRLRIAKGGVCVVFVWA